MDNKKTVQNFNEPLTLMGIRIVRSSNWIFWPW